jgi:hypothetical protein
MSNTPKEATPSETLRDWIMNPCRSKSEQEWWAAQEIEKLERERDELRRERDEALVLAGGASTLRELANLHVEALLCWSTAERERDEERTITFRQADCIEELERERDEARQELADEMERGRVMRGLLESGGNEWRECAEKLSAFVVPVPVEMADHAACAVALAEFERLKGETK